MIVNILKDSAMFYYLSKYNYLIENVSKHWKYNSAGQEYDFEKRIISSWFNPAKIRELGISRIYPEHSFVQYRPEYCLKIHCSNYLPLFLINLFYSSRKNILIEDVGGGMCWFFLYLHILKFNNFHLCESFEQLSQEAAQNFINLNFLPCKINDKKARPIISNNVGVPEFLVREVTPELELICCYTNRGLEKRAEEYEQFGFKFLCKDFDDLAFAYCRENKYNEFKEKLIPYKVNEMVINDIIP